LPVFKKHHIKTSETKMDIKALKSKVDELKSLFILAQRILPFMEELFSFINDVSPLLEDINGAIKDNLKKMPNATKQLSKVTQATETASTEIMDTVDRVNADIEDVMKQLKQFRDAQMQVLENPLTLLQTIADAITAGKDVAPMLDDINQFITRTHDIINTEHATVITNIIDKVAAISDDANSIINSLQIQDITAQQLAAVNHLLETIQNRLSGIMKHLEPEAFPSVQADANFDDTIQISKLHRNIAFDPEAVDSMSATNRQQDVDALLADPSALLDAEPEEDEAEQSPVNIDDLLSQFENSNGEEESVAPVEATEETNTDEISQDDIDALFK
jgi:methyl-accepting chemotaxis protein